MAIYICNLFGRKEVQLSQHVKGEEKMSIESIAEKWERDYAGKRGKTVTVGYDIKRNGGRS